MARRLAAILAADVVGYSRLMGADEEGVLDRLRVFQNQIIDPLVAQHNGRIFKVMGDGFLGEFASVVDAAACAVAWQDASLKHEAIQAAELRIRFRIGINLGDVIVEGDDLYGDGVNIAARLEAIAPIDGICLSEDAWRQVRAKMDHVWEPMGPQQLKNVAEPIGAYSLTRGEGVAVPSGATSDRSSTNSGKSEVKPAGAAVPFDNMSHDPEQDYFSDGITEDLITELSRFRALTVVSRNSSFVFKGQAVALTEAAQKLGVRYVVEGSIRKAGGRVRISAQLIDGHHDRHVWAERYDREIKDIFEVQDDVVRRVASTLVDRLEFERHERALAKQVKDMQAYDLYLQAREHLFAWSEASNLRAIELLEQATEREAGYAPALALHSEARLRQWLNGWSAQPEADLAEARRLGKLAVEADAGDSRTHTAMGMASLFTRDPDLARHHFQSAMSLNPNDTRALAYMSRYSALNGDNAGAIDLVNRARELNPFGKYNWNLAVAMFAGRRYDEAAAAIANISEPNGAVLAIHAASLATLGHDAEAAAARARFEAARDTTRMLREASDGETMGRFFAERWPFRDPADAQALSEALDRAGITKAG
jgi:adenylate cyclase